MVKSLLLLSALLGVNSMPVASNSDEQYYGVQERQYQHTEDVGNTQVTYKYETNEVNSIDDLVVGNIYEISLPSSLSNYTIVCSCSMVIGYRSNNEIRLQISKDLGINLYNGDANTIYASISNISYTINKDAPIIIQYLSDFNSSLISYVSSTNYNEIVSVTYTPPTTIFGHLAEVLGDNLYGGIPNVDNVIFTIGGQEITLKSWLVTSTCIVLAVVLITILCLFIRWLFKLFSNTILLR